MGNFSRRVRVKDTSHASAPPSRAFIAVKSWNRRRSIFLQPPLLSVALVYLIVHVDPVQLVVEHKLRHGVRGGNRVRAAARRGVGRAERGDDDADTRRVVL